MSHKIQVIFQCITIFVALNHGLSKVVHVSHIFVVTQVTFCKLFHSIVQWSISMRQTDAMQWQLDSQAVVRWWRTSFSESSSSSCRSLILARTSSNLWCSVSSFSRVFFALAPPSLLMTARPASCTASMLGCWSSNSIFSIWTQPQPHSPLPDASMLNFKLIT